MTIAAYEDQNVFARGEIPCLKVYEADLAWPFSTSCRDRRATHWLFRKPHPAALMYRTMIFAEVARSATRIATAAMKAFKVERIIIQQFSEPASGKLSSTCMCM